MVYSLMPYLTHCNMYHWSHSKHNIKLSFEPFLAFKNPLWCTCAILVFQRTHQPVFQGTPISMTEHTIMHYFRGTPISMIGHTTMHVWWSHWVDAWINEWVSESVSQSPPLKTYAKEKCFSWHLYSKIDEWQEVFSVTVTALSESWQRVVMQ